MYYLLAEIEVLLSKTEQFGSVEKAPAFCVAVFRQSFMQRVHAENTCISRCLGSRAKPILLGLCAARVIYPVSITYCYILSCRKQAHSNSELY